MPSRLRVSAVSYLNSVPLVWGFLHGRQQNLFDLRFDLPSECADLLRAGQVDVGLVPSIQLAAQPDLLIIPGCSISSRGEVRSILLISRKPIEEIETVAADTSSRSSVALAQIILARKYHRHVKIRPYPPRVPEMLDIADAALIIGDPALRFDLMTSWPAGDAPPWIYDLGAEWTSWTRLPMVYAVWAVRRPAADLSLAAIFQDAAQFGLDRREEIAAAEAPRRDIGLESARDYLFERIHYGWGEPENRGLSLFLEYAAGLGLAPRRSVLETLDQPALAR